MDGAFPKQVASVRWRQTMARVVLSGNPHLETRTCLTTADPLGATEPGGAARRVCAGDHMLDGVQVLRPSVELVAGIGGVGGVAQGTFEKSKKSSRLGCDASREVR